MLDVLRTLTKCFEGARQLPSPITVIERVDRAAAIPALTIGVMLGACVVSSAPVHPVDGDECSE